MSYFRLALYLVSLFAGVVLAGDTVHLDSLVQQCKFMVDGIAFDLCPLLEKPQKEGMSVVFTRDTPPTVTSNWYKFSIDGPLARNESKPASMQCPDGTWICLTTWNRAKDKTWREGRLLNTVPVAGAMTPGENDPLFQKGEYTPGVQMTARMSRLWFAGGDEDLLSIRLQGGYYVDTAQYAGIYFICDRDHENTKFEHVHSHDGGHFFTWRSPHSCAVSRRAVPTPPKGGKPDGEYELVPPPFSSHPNRGYWTALLSLASVLGVIAYLIYSPPRPLRRQVQQFLKNHPSLLRFRVGESVLVRWAHEDVLLEDLDDETVVNGDDVNYSYEEEQIPLKPSPRKTGIATYGSMR